jgi:hypothetical protein
MRRSSSLSAVHDTQERRLRIVRFTLAIAAALLLLVSAAPAASIDMPLDGSWIVLDENMSVGDFFDNTYVWNSPYRVTLDVTDLFVVTDEFEVYDFGTLVLTTPSLPDWDTYAANPFTDPPFTADPDVAWTRAAFSKGSITFDPGAHSITIRDIKIPVTSIGGGPFPDGTVAFRGNIPEPGSLVLLGLGVLGVGGLVYRRRSKSA